MQKHCLRAIGIPFLVDWDVHNKRNITYFLRKISHQMVAPGCGVFSCSQDVKLVEQELVWLKNHLIQFGIFKTQCGLAKTHLQSSNNSYLKVRKTYFLSKTIMEIIGVKRTFHLLLLKLYFLSSEYINFYWQDSIHGTLIVEPDMCQCGFFMLALVLYLVTKVRFAAKDHIFVQGRQA